MLEGGRHVADIALVYPIESLWASFVPQLRGTRGPEVARIAKTFHDAEEALFRAQRDFDIVDSDALATATVSGDALRVGSHSFHALVLPAVSVLPLGVLRKARDLVRAGGAVIAIGDLPVNSPAEFPSAEAGAMVREMFGSSGQVPGLPSAKAGRGPAPRGVYLPFQEAKRLPQVLSELIEPDLLAAAGSPVRYRHFNKAGQEFYFIINDSPAKLSEELAIRAEGRARAWNPDTGEVASASPSNARWQVSLRPYGSVFLSFNRARKPRRPQNIGKSFSDE